LFFLSRGAPAAQHALDLSLMPEYQRLAGTPSGQREKLEPLAKRRDAWRS